ncbi:hypothetical protein ES707_10357 [subsurface metagenome]
MDGHEELGLDQVQQQLQLLLAGVPVNMDLRYLAVEHLRPLLEQVVHRAVYQGFVARYGGGGEDHGVPPLYVDLAVVSVSHPHQGGGRLPLAAGDREDYLIAGHALQFVYLCQYPRWGIEIAQLQGYTHGIGHAAPDDAHPPPVLGGGVYYLLYAGYQRGEGGDNHSPRRLGDDPVQGFAHHLLGGGVAGQLGVGGIGEEEQYPLRPQLRQPGQLGGLAVHWGVVQLEVPAVYHGAHRGADYQPDGIRYAVADMERLHPELAQDDLAAGGYHLEPGSGEYPPLLELAGDEPNGELGGVDGDIELGEQVGQGTDVVLVPVGDDDSSYLVPLLGEVGGIWEDQVHPQHLLVGEREAGIDDNDVVAVFHHHHVLADFGEPAEGDYLQPWFSHIFSP